MNTRNVADALAQLDRLGGRALVGDVLGAFGRQVPARIGEMRAAGARGDHDGLARAAHSLRSSCGQLGAAGLAERCRLLEVLGQSGTVEETAPLIDGLEADLARLLNELEAQMSPEPGPELRRRCIGVVEDNDDTRMIIRTILQPYYEVDDCADGPAALERFAARPPEAILLDISLPGMDGPTVLKELRRMPAFETVPVIALTAHAMVGDREWYLANGFDEYISKPILDERDLLEVLKEVLGRRHDP